MDEEYAIELTETFQRAFSLFDSDATNSIPMNELATVMRALGQNPTEDEIEEIIMARDQFNRDKIDFDSFKAIMLARLNKNNKEKDLIAAFQAFDKDKSGKIKCEELREAFLAFNKDLTEEQVEEMINQFDPEKLGDFEYTEVAREIISVQNAPAKSGKKKGKGKKKKK
jgi:Ca2+-binding EF-hand superfamily protein